jgi:glycerol-3-phosphate acyltransferase PlsY
MIVALYVAVALIGYLLGSIPFGVLISKLSTKTDITQVGSGKTGMTNVLRTAGRKAAALSLVLDIAKGAVSVIIARLLVGDSYPSAQALAALAVLVGHSWSVFIKFKGGRGVASFLGTLLPMCWPVAIISGLIMIFVALISKYMSLGSITGAIFAFIILIPLYILDIGSIEYEYLIYALIGAIFITVMHHDNIRRLLAGTERKLGQKVEADNSPSSGNHNQ